jgi:hypothetical protein
MTDQQPQTSENKQADNPSSESHEERESQPQLSPPASEVEMRHVGPEQTRKELKEAIEGSNDVLVTATTTLALFPDTVTVDRAKLTITRRTFLRSAEIMSMRMEDILNVTATVGPLFGTVKIVSRVLNAEKPHTIGRFWRHDAVRLKRITQGYVIALQRNIDVSTLKTPELVKMLDELGTDEHPL